MAQSLSPPTQERKEEEGSYQGWNEEHEEGEALRSVKEGSRLFSLRLQQQGSTLQEP